MINENEIWKLLGYKNLKSYNNSKKSKVGIELLLATLTERLEAKHNRQIKELKESIIKSIKEL